MKTQIRILTLLHGIQAYMDCMYQLASILGYPVQEKLQSEKGDALVQIIEQGRPEQGKRKKVQQQKPVEHQVEEQQR